jgi:hypothetical protein
MEAVLGADFVNMVNPCYCPAQRNINLTISFFITIPHPNPFFLLYLMGIGSLLLVYATSHGALHHSSHRISVSKGVLDMTADVKE